MMTAVLLCLAVLACLSVILVVTARLERGLASWHRDGAADAVDAETPAVASTARVGLPVSAGFAEREPGQDRGAYERHGLRSVNVRHK